MRLAFITLRFLELLDTSSPALKRSITELLSELKSVVTEWDLVSLTNFTPFTAFNLLFYINFLDFDKESLFLAATQPIDDKTT
jgi:hypothetical protein